MVLYWWVASFAHLLLLPIIRLALDRLLPTPHPSLPPFSQEECQELLTLLRSFSREYPYCNRWLLDIHLISLLDVSAQTVSIIRTRVVSKVLLRIGMF